MKVTHAEKHVLGSSGLSETKGFEIRASAHAFKILSSGLYSDKVTAVLREIGCNAYDAHVAAGIAHRPFDVKLPNRLDPRFYIRDYGPGLSHQDVLNLYTTYFASTKQESNDFTGAFGLGSKSPFSYTDSFTVTASHGGKKRLYSAHIGDRGAPLVSLMSETDADADWPTGLEVGFPVKQSEFAEFATKAQAVFCCFATVPNVLGAPPIQRAEIEEDHGTYGFMKGDERQWILMGNVRYPLQFNHLKRGSSADEPDEDPDYDVEVGSDVQVDTGEPILDVASQMSGLVLKVPIGSVQVAASRESLQYDPASKRYLRKAVKVAVRDVLKSLEAAHSTVKTWDDMCAFKEKVATVSRGLYLRSDVFGAVGINNKRLVEACMSNWYELKDVRKTGVSLAILSLESRRNGSQYIKTNRPWSETGTKHLAYERDYCVLTGLADKSFARAKRAMHDRALSGKVILVYGKNPKEVSASDVDEVSSSVLKSMPGLPVHDLTKFPPPDTKVRSRKGSKILPPLPANVMVKLDGALMAVSEVPDERKLYVPTQMKYGDPWRYFLRNDDAATNTWSLESRIEELAELAKHIPSVRVPTPIPIARKDVVELRLRRRPEWRPYLDVVVERLTDQSNVDELAKLAGKHEAVIDMSNYRSAIDLLTVMVCMKEYDPEVFKLAKPVLKRHGVLDEIEGAHKRSKGKNYRESITEPRPLTLYKQLVSQYEIKIDTPQFHAATMSLSKSFPGTNDVEYSTYTQIAKLTPNSFPAFLEELMTKKVTKES